MNLRIIKAGVLDTIQDAGRYRYQHLGINRGGYMDSFAAQLANMLAGNDRGEALIELHFPASSFFFEAPALIAITGADFTATINGDEIPGAHPVLVNKYSVLQFQRLEKGARAYLAIQGGLKLSSWLNSYSTNLKAETGGYEGRSLRKDDEIPLCGGKDLETLIGKKEFEVLHWSVDEQWGDESEGKIFITTGNEWNLLDAVSKEEFLDQLFSINSQSDRMGYRLDSGALSMTQQDQLVSSAVNFGTVQLLPDGQLIVLMADHQTAGGYPRIAHVISAHHSKLSQLKAGDVFRFEIVDQLTAERLFIKQQQHLLQVENACRLRLESFCNAHRH
jgi:antagonist of KipI